MSIKEKMEAKREKAIEEIKAEFWNDQPDDDRISEIALANGIDAGSVAKWQDEIEGAKGRKAEVANLDLDALKADAKRKQTAAKATHTKLEKAQAAHDIAARKSKVADRAVKDAEMAVESLTRELYKINSPQAQIPSRCQKIHAVDLASERRDAARQAARQTRQQKDRLVESVESMESQIDELAKRGGKDAVGLTSSGRMMPASEINRSKLEAEKKRLKKAREADDEAEKALEPLDQAVADARREANI